MDAVARWVRDLPLTTADALLAIALAIVAAALTPLVSLQHGSRHADVLAELLAVGAALVLIGRRRAPRLVLAASVAAMIVYEARGYQGGPALLAPLVALYTVATVDGRIRSLALAALVGIALSVARLGFTGESAGTAATDAVGYLSAALFLGWAVANRRAYVGEIRARAEHAERTREQEARRRVDAERLRIARELHDAVAHSIATINVQAGVAAHVIGDQPQQAGEALIAIKDSSKRALAELREILGLLRTPDDTESRAPTPGLDRLDALIDASRQAGVRVELEVQGDPSLLPVAIDLAAYRILQESLTNVIRHAAPASAHVRIDCRDPALALTVTDDGQPNGAFSQGSGHGIAGMRERALALGGTLNAGPRPDGGFQVTALLPLHRAA
jgi:signal transduction histidine kinase